MIFKYGLTLASCYWLGSCYYEWGQRAEERERDRELSMKCYEKIGGMELVPMPGGQFVDRKRLPGFHFSISMRNGLCEADIFEGSFWWTGSEILPVYVVKREPDRSWGHFNVVARLYRKKVPADPPAMGLRYTDWPEDLVVRLKNYPGLELWLDAPPPSVKNEFSVKNFVVREWRRRDGTPRVIVCNGLGSPASNVQESGLSRSDLAEFTKPQLENLNFGKMAAYCNVGLHDFDFEGGDVRVGIGIHSLSGSSVALPMLQEYLSKSIITGK
jgi:hypothetical protein